MTRRIPDTRLANMAGDLQVIGAELASLIGETALNYPEAALQLTEVLRLLSDAHTVLRDATATEPK